MENKRQVGAFSFDHLFGPKDSSSSSSSNGIFGSIFPPPSKVLGRDSGVMGNQFGTGNGNGKYGNADNITQSIKGQNSSVSDKDKNLVYQSETVEPCYFSSSIYYGGQENYSPRTRNLESHHNFKKDNGDDDPNGNNSNSASRGNWWQGSLYY